MGDSATSLPDWLPDGYVGSLHFCLPYHSCLYYRAKFIAYVIVRMDPNSTYLLRIKLVGNKRKTRQEFSSCYNFTKVVDADTTKFKDFVESIVNEFPPRYKEVAIVQYYDDASKTLPEVKTDQDMLSMFEKHGNTKIVCMTIAYYNPLEEAPQLVTKWTEWTPSPLGKRHSDC
jgi:arginine/lysine/ornithine decarboxylase